MARGGEKNGGRGTGRGEGISDFGNVLLTEQLGSEGKDLDMVLDRKRLANNHSVIYLEGGNFLDALM